MCGIAAQYGRVDAAAGARMLERLTHRGPDDDGCVTVEGANAWLGHRRLSIVDVEGGHQPLVGAHDDVYLVGNGEVYNHEDIRRRLGHAHFRTSSDNEVALQLVERDGPDCLAEMNGMFAFAVAGEDGRFIAARDPVGIKPLYWARHDGQVVFASEMNAFEPSMRGHIEVFPPGCYWTPDTGVVQFATAVPDDARANPAPPMSRDEALAATREILVDAVERQMMGDVPVGVFLSGGLDSSLVAAIAQNYLRHRVQTLKTCAVGTEGSPDLVAARVVAEYLVTERSERVYTAEEATAA